MKINDINRTQGINNYRKLGQKGQEVKARTSKDQITISNEAKALLEETKGITNTEKIQQIKDQIDKGTYHVDAKLIADKMLNWHKKLK